MKLRRGLALAAGAVAIVLLLATLVAAMLMQPQRLARLVLGGVGANLGLEITFEGEARYRLRGTPMLEVRDISVRRADGGDTGDGDGDSETILRAGRAMISLPWSTVLDRSGPPLALHGIELDAPVLDLPRLQAWLASRPPGDGRLPSLSEGIRVRDGQVLAEGWELRDLDLYLPRFAAHAALAAEARGRLLMASPTRVHFDLQLAATRPANGAGASARGQVRIEHEHWQLPAAVTASGPLRVGDGSWWIMPLRFGAAGSFQGEGDPLPFEFGAHGPLRLRDGTWTLVPASIVLRGEGIIPTLEAQGRAALGRALLLELAGTLPDWPDAWPALPAPLGTSASPIGVSLGYAGASDLSDPVALRMRRDDAIAEASARVAALLDWMDALHEGSPLPPLHGRASAPRIEVPGGTLEGVEIILDADPAE